MLSIMKRIWKSWKRGVHRINTVISVVLMTVVYVTAMFPVAIGFKLFKPDALDRGLGDEDSNSYWIKINRERQDVRRAQRPW